MLEVHAGEVASAFLVLFLHNMWQIWVHKILIIVMFSFR